MPGVLFCTVVLWIEACDWSLPHLLVPASDREQEMGNGKQETGSGLSSFSGVHQRGSEDWSSAGDSGGRGVTVAWCLWGSKVTAQTALGEGAGVLVLRF